MLSYVVALAFSFPNWAAETSRRDVLKGIGAGASAAALPKAPTSSATMIAAPAVSEFEQAFLAHRRGVLQTLVYETFSGRRLEEFYLDPQAVSKLFSIEERLMREFNVSRVSVARAIDIIYHPKLLLSRVLHHDGVDTSEIFSDQFLKRYVELLRQISPPAAENLSERHKNLAQSVHVDSEMALSFQKPGGRELNFRIFLFNNRSYYHTEQISTEKAIQDMTPAYLEKLTAAKNAIAKLQAMAPSGLRDHLLSRLPLIEKGLETDLADFPKRFLETRRLEIASQTWRFTQDTTPPPPAELSPELQRLMEPGQWIEYLNRASQALNLANTCQNVLAELASPAVEEESPILLEAPRSEP